MSAGSALRRLGALTALVLAALVLYAIDWEFTGSDFTAYSVECADVVVGNTCKRPTRAEYVTTYKVFKDQQFVVSEGFVPIRYNKCAIVSRTSWTCDFDDGSGSFGVRDGTFWQLVPSDSSVKPLIEHRAFVPRWKFLAVKYGLAP